MNRSRRTLARDLRAIGVSKGETVELTQVAKRLGGIHAPGLSAASRERIAARLPVDVALHTQSRTPGSVRWAVAGACALLVIVAGIVWVVPSSRHTHDQTHDSQAHESPKPNVPERQLEQQMQQLEQLQQQPVVNQQQIEKAKNNFQQQYEQYQRDHSTDNDFKNRWDNYQSQWWWQGKASSHPAETKPTNAQQSSQLHSSDTFFLPHR